MNKIERARIRNWTKARIMGLIVGMNNPIVLTDRELEIISEIEELKNLLLKEWDDNSVTLGMKVKKPKKELFQNIEKDL